MDTETECPFCGGEAVIIIEDGRQFCCMCQDCYAQGPTASTKVGAAEAWNERA